MVKIIVYIIYTIILYFYITSFLLFSLPFPFAECFSSMDCKIYNRVDGWAIIDRM